MCECSEALQGNRQKRVEGPDTWLKRKYGQTGGQGVEKVRVEELSGKKGEQSTLNKKCASPC